MSLVSVALLSYNHDRFLEQRINSILNQSFQDFELIILDDGSTDASIQILTKYKNHPKVVHFEVNPVNGGSAFKQWQKGISIARGEFLWLAESDDFSSPEFLEESVKCLQTNQNISFVFCSSTIVDENNCAILNLVDLNQSISFYNWDQNFIVNGNQFIANALTKLNVVLNASSVVFRKRHLNQLNSSYQKYKYCGDWLFWGELAINSEVAYLSNKLNYFRNHDLSTRVFSNHGNYIDRIIEELSVRSTLFELAGITDKPIKDLDFLWKIISKSVSLRNVQSLFHKLKFFGLKITLVSKFHFLMKAVYNFFKFSIISFSK